MTGLVYFRFNIQICGNIYKNHENTFWTVQEIDVSIDRKEWDTLSNNEKNFTENIFAIFSEIVTLLF